MADVLLRLGAVHALVVHGHDGTDEITTLGPTHVCELRNGTITAYEVRPEQFGLPENNAGQLAGGTAIENASIALNVLRGERSPARDIVLLNAGAAIYVAGRADSLADGVVLATGAALDLTRLAPELARLRPVKGHILRAGGGPTGGPAVRAPRVYICPTPGMLILGATMETDVADTAISDDPNATIRPLSPSGDAAIAGLPVIATAVGGVPEALGHGADGTRPGLLVPPGDPIALGEALRSWLADAGVRARLRRAAGERRSSLAGWSTTTAALATVLAGATP